MPELGFALPALTEAFVAGHGRLPCHLASSRRLAHERQALLAQLRDQDPFNPRARFRVVAVTGAASGRLLLEDGRELRSPLAAHRLARAERLLFAVCTLGPGVAALAEALFHGRQALRGLLLDEVAVTTLFWLARQVDAAARKEAERAGLRCSGALSPGDGGFPLAEQGLVLELAGARRAGVRLSPGMAMSPTHSLSMVYGLGRRMRHWDRGECCDVCPAREKCHHRQPRTASAPVAAHG